MIARDIHGKIDHPIENKLYAKTEAKTANSFPQKTNSDKENVKAKKIKTKTNNSVLRKLSIIIIATITTEAKW